MSRYLTNAEIRAMAQVALENYELSCEWRKAREAATEYALEEYGFKPGPSAIALALKMAQAGWHGVVIATKKAARQSC